MSLRRDFIKIPLAAAFVSLGLPVRAQQRALTLLNASYDPTRELYVAVNRAPAGTRAGFRADLERCAGAPVTVGYGDRSVAASWNWGCDRALEDGADFLLLLANDVTLGAGCLDALLAYGADPENAGVAMWSGTAVNLHPGANLWANTDGCDFSAAMFRPETFEKAGRFDENFRPAYYEDNDYAARVVLGGGRMAQLGAAHFQHLGSQTIKSDPEMHHHANYWQGHNKHYFCRKWGQIQPRNASEDMRRDYYPTPFNDPTKPLTWWPPVG